LPTVEAKWTTLAAQSVVSEQNLSAILAELTKPVSEIGESLLVSATYDGDSRLAMLKFYDQKAGRNWLWEDNTGHKPYCYTRLSMDELQDIRRRKDVVDIIEEERLDLLNDQTVKLRKIITTDPLAIGGGNDSIRDKIKAWEADIKYYENYAYDRGLQMGTYYKVAQGKVTPVEHAVPDTVMRSLQEITVRNPKEFGPYLTEWAELLGQPVADFRRVAMDIEVANEEGRLPDAEQPEQPVIAVSFFNDVEKVVFLLRNGKDTGSLGGAPFSTQVFDKEILLLKAVMAKIMEYPFLVTFNGDNFDLRYLKHRAEKLGIREEEDPIQLERVAANLKHGVHIDLYQFFRNRSIQVYAFANKYTEHTLDAVADTLLGKSKLEFEGEIGDIPLRELAGYCLNDSQLTYELTSMGDSLVMKLLLVIARIGRMPMNDVSRLGVSNWIRSMLFYEHRKMGALIPRQDELSEKGGASSQAIIKGKKYKGGLVIEPKPGVHFDVSVMDFASLYPSLIKVHNLSYETVNCPHPECKKNRIPDTESWECSRRKGITSLIIGSLRDLRVSHYKVLAKDHTLSKTDRDLYNVVSQGLKVYLNACFSGDTQVVTPEGIRNIKDFKVGDKVINVNPETLQVEEDRVVEVQSFDYSGIMYHFRDGGTTDLLVTPNHRFLVVDSRKGSKSGTIFRTADEVYKLTNMRIPLLRAPIREIRPPPRVSMLEIAKELEGEAHFYCAEPRLSNWFRKLDPRLKRKIRAVGVVRKYPSKVNPRLRSHYTLPATEVTEADVDAVEAAGGFVLVGTRRGSKIPVRFEANRFAELCGWYVSEGNPVVTLPREYVSGNYRGKSTGILITQSQGRGNPNGLLYRADIERLLRTLGLPISKDSANRKYFKVSSSILHEWTIRNCYVTGAKEHVSRTKRIPDFVFASKHTMQSFLDTAYMGDGSTGEALYSTTSRWLAEGLVVLLTYLGSKTRMKWDQGIYRIHFSNTTSKLTYSGNEKHKHVSRAEFEGKVFCVTTEKNHTVFAGRNGRFVPVGQSYGSFGFESFAFYCLPVAEATAALGRDAISRTIEKAKELGIEVAYGDTDSLFMRSPSKEQIETIRHWADKELGVELDLDKVYRYVAFSSRKKNYFGVLPDGTVDIRGLTGKKSQTPEYLKETFYSALDILSRVQSPEDFEKARASIKDLLGGMITSLKGKKVPVQKLAFNVMMGKPTEKYNGTTPQHVRAAKLLEEKGREIKAGEMIAYVKTKNPPYVKPVDLAKVDDIDPDKYIEYAHSMFDQMLDALDFSFDEIMGATTLDFFWSS
jgi:DNA polymerase elongation subunit (family B)